MQHNFSSNVPPKNAETHEINTPKNTPYSNFKQDSTSQRLFKNTASQKYYVGTRVIHRGINANNSYGNGIVKAVFEKEIQIEFDGGILKKLPLNTCGNYLSIVSHPPRKSHNISQKNKNDINVHPPKKEVSKTISAQPLAESEPIPPPTQKEQPNNPIDQSKTREICETSEQTILEETLPIQKEILEKKEEPIPPTQKEQPNNPIDQSETREICEICETSEQTILEETLPIQKEILEEKEETISTDPEPENSPAKSKTLTVAIFVLSVAILILLGLNFKNFTDFFQEL